MNSKGLCSSQGSCRRNVRPDDSGSTYHQPCASPAPPCSSLAWSWTLVSLSFYLRASDRYPVQVYRFAGGRLTSYRAWRVSSVISAVHFHQALQRHSGLCWTFGYDPSRLSQQLQRSSLGPATRIQRYADGKTSKPHTQKRQAVSIPTPAVSTSSQPS